MFRTVSPSIIRSLALYTQQWYRSYRLCWLLASGIRMELVEIVYIGVVGGLLAGKKHV